MRCVCLRSLLDPRLNCSDAHPESEVANLLQADFAAIVELWDAGRIIRTLVVGLFGEEHVVLAEIAGAGIRILGRSLVPEGEVAVAAEEVGAEDASIIAETGQVGRVRYSYYGNVRWLHRAKDPVVSYLGASALARRWRSFLATLRLDEKSSNL